MTRITKFKSIIEIILYNKYADKNVKYKKKINAKSNITIYIAFVTMSSSARVHC